VPERSESKAQALPQAAAAGKVTLHTFDEKQFAETLKKYRGKVLLVDFWATWCAPCKEDFPHAVRLHRELASRGLAVVSVSLDLPDKEPEVLKFLTAQGATMDNFIAAHGGSGEAFQVLQIPDGTLPHLKLFDRAGKLRKSFPEPSSPVKPAEVDRAVKELLDEPAGAG
jgi:thiol-disulfide isomerase/thioredoxin